MERMAIAVGVVVAVVLGVSSATSGVGAQQAGACLHGPNESPADAGRRKLAIAYVRAVNAAQARVVRSTKTYRAAADLAGVPAPPAGFEAQLTAAPDAYAVSLKDTIDPCRFTLFSDQEGIIYVGAPLQ